MSGECDDCGEHTLECRCKMNIEMWAQIFFEDGTVSQGIRFPAEWLDDPKGGNIERMLKKLLDDMNREEGWFLLWGAGNMVFNHYPTSFSSELLESDSSA